MAKPPPNRVGKYELAEVIGEGAMGTVYRAVDPALHRDVAIKLMKKSFSNDPHLRDRFEREARAAAGLQHPNIVTVHDFGESKGHLYIVMEYVAGTDLAQLLRSRTPLSLDTRLGIVVGVLQALGYAHGRGVVHRDVKPANIRVLEDGRVKIMDFGIAHLTGSEITYSGVVLGTPDYMAPEQVEGRPITPATDIFAVGAVLYELLTHQKPFQGETVHAVLHKVVTAEPALEDADPSQPVPDDLKEVIQTALAKDTRVRYASAEAMIEALTLARGLLSERDMEATILLRPSAGTHQRRHRRWIAVGAVTVVVAGGVTAVRLAQPRSTAGRSAGSATAASATRDSAQKSSPPVATTPMVSESAFAPLRRAALDARARASKAGATRAALAMGDSLAREAEGLAALGRQSEAVERLAATATRWQTARTQAQQKPVPPVGVRQAAEGTASRLAQAVASRDVEAIRRVYPNLASDEQDRWVQFFQTTESVTASLHVDSLEAQGRRASAVIRGVYEYLPMNAAERKRETVEYRATFERAAGGWRLAMLRRGLFKK